METIDREKNAAAIQTAYEIAREAHKGQFRRDGITPYLMHASEVAGRCASISLDAYLCGWLHDVLEDSTISVDDLLKRGIPRRVARAVCVLTKTKGVSYDDYLCQVRSDSIAREVKIQDMLANLSDSPTPKQIRKYAKGLLFLTE